MQKRHFFCTHRGTENKPLFDEMEALCEQRPVDMLAVSQEEVKKGAYQDKLRQFAFRLEAHSTVDRLYQAKVAV
jgi:hypothetical protein